MTIRMVNHPNGKTELKLEGRIDSNNAEQVKESLLKVAAENNDILLNLQKLDYISSAGLRALLILQKQINRQGSRLTLCHVSDSVREVFELTGFVNLLNIER